MSTPETRKPSMTLGRCMLRALPLVGVMVVLLLSPAPGCAQVDLASIPPGETLYEIELEDGSEFVARLLARDGDTLTLQTVGGASLTVRVADVREALVARGYTTDGEFRRADPNESRLFFTATGRTLGQGQAYASAYFGVLPFIGYGITDRITIAAGAPVLLGELEPFWIAPKIKVVDRDRTDVALGVLHFVLEDEQAGIAYGVGTFGGDDGGVSIGLGFGYTGSDVESNPAIMVGLEGRGRGAKFISENYLIPGEIGVISGGVRFIGRRFTADLGVAAGGTDGEFACCLPVVSVSYAFGRGR